MDAFFVVLGLLVLAFPIMAIVALVKSVGLGEQLRRVETRLAALERARVAPAPDVSEQQAPVETPAPPTPPPISEPMAAPIAPEPAAPSEPEPAIAASAPAPGAAAAPGMSFEERLGTQWAVWVGGLALALGGIFLVRYSIEQGLLGPPVRIALGALLAAALIAAGEWARRTERLAGLSGLPTAHIPSILTAAGTTVAYADVYAAHALYGFLAPGSAFILLGLVALATLAAALLHGPALAGLGLVGAYVTPLLVASQRPDYWSLYVYLAVVTAAAFALARFRMWRWLAITAVAFSTLWTLPGIGVVGVDALGAHAFHVIVGFALAASLIVAGLWFGPDALPGRIDGVSSAALGAYLLAATLLVLVSRHDPLALVTFAVLAAATVAIAWRAEAATAAVPVAAVLVVLVFVRWAADLDIERLVMPSGPVAGAVPEPPKTNAGWHLVLGAAFALLFGGAGYLAQGRSEREIVPVLWSAAAVFAPIAILAALYYRIAGFEPSIPFAAAALLLSALYAFATETLDKHAPRPGLPAASAIFATGAVAALALALTLALERGWLTVALALMVPGIAWVADKRPLPALRVLVAVIGVLVLARIGWEPRIVGDDVGTRPIFNWLLYGYGIPAAAFWLGGYLLRRRGDDVPARMVDAGAILLTVLLAFLEIRHFINGGDVYRDASSLAEIGLQVCVGLAMTIGLERLRLRSHSVVHDVAALVIAALTLAAIVVGLGMIENPFFTGEPVGGRFVNLILLGYGLPAVLTAILALVSRGRASEGIQRHRGGDGGGARAHVSLARSAHALSRRGAQRRPHHRCRAIHLFGGVARVRRDAARGRHASALAGGAARLGRGGHPHRLQSLPHRHERSHRNLSEPLLHRSRHRAARSRLAVSAPAVSTPRAASPVAGLSENGSSENGWAFLPGVGLPPTLGLLPVRYSASRPALACAQASDGCGAACCRGTTSATSRRSPKRVRLRARLMVSASTIPPCSGGWPRSSSSSAHACSSAVVRVMRSRPAGSRWWSSPSAWAKTSSASNAGSPVRICGRRENCGSPPATCSCCISSTTC